MLFQKVCANTKVERRHLMERITAPLQTLLDQITALLASYPLAGTWYTAVSRILFPILALLILVRAVRSLMRIPHVPEAWGS